MTENFRPENSIAGRPERSQVFEDILVTTCQHEAANIAIGLNGREGILLKEVLMFRNRCIAGMCVAALAGALMLIPATAKAALTAVGSAAPGFTLPSQEAKPVSLSSYRGWWVVLYFYPKDESAGCTIEARNFQRDLAQYQALHAVILGVSLDTVASHRSFCARDSLRFKLLADPDHRVTDAYGVPVHTKYGMHYADRITFLISPTGQVVREWTVRDIPAHSVEVLDALRSLESR